MLNNLTFEKSINIRQDILAFWCEITPSRSQVMTFFVLVIVSLHNSYAYMCLMVIFAGDLTEKYQPYIGLYYTIKYTFCWPYSYIIFKENSVKIGTCPKAREIKII